jgi:hypothetical protein
MPETVVLILVQTGIPGIMWVLTIGQLIPQLFVEEFTLPFLNLYGCYTVTKICFAAEYIGICHFSWLLFHSASTLIFGKVHETAAEAVDSVPAVDGDIAVSHEPAAQNGEIEMNNYAALTVVTLEEHNTAEMPIADDVEHAIERRVEFDEISMSPSDAARANEFTWWDLVRYTWSTFVTLGSVFIVCVGIYHHYSVLPSPVAANFVIFASMLVLLFYLEGLMICIVATQYWDPESFKDTHPRAYQLHLLVNRPEYLKRFIIGRQFFTVLTNFLIAQIAVFPTWSSEGYPSVLFFICIKSGLVGVMITLAFAQLLPELLGARYPLFFMNMIGSYHVTLISLWIESVGIGHCAWLIYYGTRKLACGKHYHATDLKPEQLKIDEKAKV